MIITGDPPKLGDYSFATPVYDVDSIGLLEIAAGLNAGVDPTGKELDGGHLVRVGDRGRACGRSIATASSNGLARKKAAGAELVMTQPVYDPATLESFLDDASSIGLPVMVGLLPLASAPQRRVPPQRGARYGRSLQSYRDRMAASRQWARRPEPRASPSPVRP